MSVDPSAPVAGAIRGGAPDAFRPPHSPIREYYMNRLVIVASLVGATIALPALAQTTKTNPLKMKCEDFIATSETYRPAVVYYIAGVDKMGIAETDTMVEDTATPVNMVVEECQKSPKATVRSKVRAMYKSGKLPLFEHH
ncbi:MAG TPA: HdeA/HdeB family chaperone [Paraburkholderia sp.]|nr:HdeA/HdeB family chaperone [Paraburkholderia sp.]